MQHLPNVVFVNVHVLIIMIVVILMIVSISRLSNNRFINTSA